MRNSRWIALATLALLVAGSDPAKADGDEKVKFADLPEVVRKTIKAKYPEAKIGGASKETEDGETTYEVELTIDGQAIDIVLDSDGDIEGVEREIPAEDLPRAVLVAAKTKFPDAKIGKVEEITADDVVVYELTFRIKGKDTEIVMSPNGKILEDGDDEEKGKAKDDDDEKAKKKKKQKEQAEKPKD